MRLARVCGTVVATVKADGLARHKLLLLQDVDAANPQGKPSHAESYVAVDLIGAGEGEIVLVTLGSGARIDSGSEGVPTDAAVIAIVDSVQVGTETTFVKH